MMRKERMNGMSALMDHSGNIAHLSGCIHKNKWSAGFRQGTVITTESFSFPAVQVEPSHFLHPDEAFAKEGVHAVKTFNGLVHQFLSCCKWIEWLHTFRLCFCIPWT